MERAQVSDGDRADMDRRGDALRKRAERTALKLCKAATPAVNVSISDEALRNANQFIEGAIASGWTRRERRIVLRDILMRCRAATMPDGSCRIIWTGE